MQNSIDLNKIHLKWKKYPTLFYTVGFLSALLWRKSGCYRMRILCCQTETWIKMSAFLLRSLLILIFSPTVMDDDTKQKLTNWLGGLATLNLLLVQMNHYWSIYFAMKINKIIYPFRILLYSAFKFFREIFIHFY